MSDELHETVRRAVRRTTWITVLGAVVGVGVGLWLSAGEDPLERALVVVGGLMAIGGFAGTATALIAKRRMSSVTSAPTTGLDAAGKRAVQKAVFAGVPVEPRDPLLALRAADLAEVLSLTLPLATAQFVLLYGGIIGSQVIGLVSSNGWGATFRIILVVVMVIAGVVVIVLMRRSALQVDRYRRALNTDGPAHAA
ncbi:hypothetical protein [Curtobacterium sp. BH-2-1-1]|uniref:hypothetical protein n=1 Tax=Curtobacterium sp. BH-2-1-1 TaxID=1905847 RepID=UPI00119CC96B|nr:hypothetical protein [Curtobacterium sp. BH-2-1-1]